MKAFFADIRETGLIPDRGRGAWGEKLTLPTEEQARRLTALDEQITALRRGLDAQAQQLKKAALGLGRSPAAGLRSRQTGLELPAARGGIRGQRRQPSPSITTRPWTASSICNGSLSSEHKRGEGLIVASGANPDNETYTVALKPGEGTWTALGIDVFQDESLPGTRFARGADRFVLTEVEAEVAEPRRRAAQAALRAGHVRGHRRTPGESAHGRYRRRSEDRMGRHHRRRIQPVSGAALRANRCIRAPIPW